MQALRRPVLMLVLLLLTSLSPLLTTGSADVNPTEHEVIPSMSEEERLALAASMWHMASASQPFSVPLQPASGVLHMNVGSFDPLGDVPEPSGVLFDANAFQTTGLAIVVNCPGRIRHTQVQRKLFGPSLSGHLLNEATALRRLCGLQWRWQPCCFAALMVSFAVRRRRWMPTSARPCASVLA